MQLEAKTGFAHQLPGLSRESCLQVHSYSKPDSQEHYLSVKVFCFFFVQYISKELFFSLCLSVNIVRSRENIPSE